jgi:hypothetical protein
MKRRTMVAAVIFSLSVGLIACTESAGETTGTESASQATMEEQPAAAQGIKPEDVKLSNPLNAEWVATGKSTYELKCQSCHKLTDEKLVGPGWAGVTKRRQPNWILNMVTNVDMMLETDPEAQKLLELCLVRMPNQNISVDEARQVLEFMRSNDGEK